MTAIRLLATQVIPIAILAVILGSVFSAPYLGAFSVTAIIVSYWYLARAHPEIAGGLFYFVTIDYMTFLLFMWGTWLIRVLT